MRGIWKELTIAAAGLALFAAIIGGSVAFALSSTGGGPAPEVMHEGASNSYRTVGFRSQAPGGGDTPRHHDCPNMGGANSSTPSEQPSNPAQY